MASYPIVIINGAAHYQNDRLRQYEHIGPPYSMLSFDETPASTVSSPPATPALLKLIARQKQMTLRAPRRKPSMKPSAKKRRPSPKM